MGEPNKNQITTFNSIVISTLIIMLNKQPFQRIRITSRKIVFIGLTMNSVNKTSIEGMKCTKIKTNFYIRSWFQTKADSE